MLISHFKFAFKSVKKHIVPSGINIFGFTIGLTGAILLMAILMHDLRFDSHHSNSDKLFRLTTKLNLPSGDRHFASSSVLTGQGLVEAIPEVEAYTRTRYLQANLVSGERVFNGEPLLFVDKDFYKGFRVDIVAGVLPKEPGDILIGSRTKERLFGEENAVGQVFQAQGAFGRTSLKISGVFKSYPTNVSLRPSFLADFEIIESIHNANYAAIMPGLDTYIITNGRVERSKLQNKLNEHFQQVLPENVREVIVHEAQSYPSVHFTRNLEFDSGPKHDKQTLWILGVLAAFIIASTFINFFNMQTALAMQRMKELSIKKALGQSRLSNILQTSFENMFILLPTVVLSGLVTVLCLLELESYTNMDLRAGWLSETNLWLFMGVIFLIFWLIASITSIVILPLSRGSLNITKMSKGNSMFRKGLIGLQFALAGFFIFNALIISKQLSYINTLDIGYEESGLMTISLNDVRDFDQALLIKNDFQSVTGVKNTSVSQSSIFGNQGKANFAVEVDTGTVNQLINVNYIDSDFIETNELTLLAGENIRKGSRGIILNQKAVERLGFSDFNNALGRQMTFVGRDTSLVYRISGIISDYHYATMHQAIEPIVLFENELAGYYNMTVRTEGQSFEPIITALEEKWHNFFPGQELSYRVMEDVLDQAYEEDFQKGKFYQLATLLLVAIAALGIFGLTYYYADQKRKEIGIRKAIGARMTHILHQMAKPIAITCFLAVIVAIPIGIYFAKEWLSGYEYGVELGALEVAVTVLLMFLLSSIALLYPGVKASRINPVEALREE